MPWNDCSRHASTCGGPACIGYARAEHCESPNDPRCNCPWCSRVNAADRIAIALTLSSKETRS